MVQVISVEPVGDSWAVRWDGTAELAHYLSGGRAEATARAAAARLAACGVEVRLDIHDRDSRRIGGQWFGGESRAD